MSQTFALALPSTDTNDLNRYIQAVNAYPILSRETEQALARRWVAQQDRNAAQTLVMSHMRYVVRVARGYLGYGLGLGDLIQEGAIGLMKAVKKFEPSKNVRLLTFAMHWIKSEIHEFIIRNWRIVKVATTKAQRKLFFNLRSKKKAAAWMTAAERQDMAATLDVAPSDVATMEMRMGAVDASFDPAPDAGEREYVPEQYLAQADANPEHILATVDIHSPAFQQRFARALASLEPRAQTIIQQRYLPTEGRATLEALATQFNISKERVRQIEARALAALREALA